MCDKVNSEASVPHVVIDTGIFVYTTRLLSTALGAAFLYTLDRMDYKIALPEVVELEVSKHTEITIREAISDINKGYRIIEATMGSRDDYKVPTDEEIENRVASRFNQLDRFISRIPFTFEHARSALMRVLNEVPPNRRKDQQFKDSAIWEAVLHQSKRSEVHFVTEDKAFFKSRAPKNGVASELQDEMENAQHKIYVHYRLEHFLTAIQDEIPALDKNAIANHIADSLIDQLLERAADKDYQLGELSRYTIEAFVTERPQILAVRFRLEFEVFDVPAIDPGGAKDGVEIAEGNCSYSAVSDEVSDIQLDRIVIQDLDGHPIPGHSHVFLRAEGLVLGRRRVSHRIRKPLPESY